MRAARMSTWRESPPAHVADRMRSTVVARSFALSKRFDPGAAGDASVSPGLAHFCAFGRARRRKRAGPPPGSDSRRTRSRTPSAAAARSMREHASTRARIGAELKSGLFYAFSCERHLRARCMHARTRAIAPGKAPPARARRPGVWQKKMRPGC
jgi:hypothetical protein